MTPQTTIRPITLNDVPALMNLSQKWYRIQWYGSPNEIEQQLRTKPGFVAEDSVGLRGFALIEPQPAQFGLITGIGVRDSWAIQAYARAIVPKLAEWARNHSLKAIRCIDSGGWLTHELLSFGFVVENKLVTYEREGQMLPHLIPQSVQLRLANPVDNASILALDQATFDPLWHKTQLDETYLFTPPHGVVVAELRQKIVGYLWYERYQEQVHISRIVVHPHYQGRRIGGQLLRYVMVQMIVQGALRFTVNTLADNQPSRALYKRFGFVETKEYLPVLWKTLP